MHQLFHLPKEALTGGLALKPSWKVSFFLTTTTTPTPVYTTSALDPLTPHTQPVVSDSSGILPPIYLDPTILYKVSVYDQFDVLQYTVDPVNDQPLSQDNFDVFYELTDDHKRTDLEISDGVTPSNYSYLPGNNLRYDSTATAYAGSNWVCYGQSATRANNSTFTVTGNYTSRYYITSRVRLEDGSGGVFMGRVQNSTFGSGVTRIVVQTDGGSGYIGNVPATISSLCREESLGQLATTSMLYNADGPGQGPFIWNRSADPDALGQLQVSIGKSAPAVNGDGETVYGSDVTLAIRAVASTRTDSLLNGGNGIAVGKSIVLHTGAAVPIVIGTFDQERVYISVGTDPTIFLAAQEAIRLVSPRADDLGGVFLTFFEDDNATRKGRIGFDDGGVSNRLIIAQEESAAPIVVSGGSKHAFTNPNKAFTFDVLDAYADDAAAAAGGVEVGELYRTGSVVKQRVS